MNIMRAQLQHKKHYRNARIMQCTGVSPGHNVLSRLAQETAHSVHSRFVTQASKDMRKELIRRQQSVVQHCYRYICIDDATRIASHNDEPFYDVL